MVNVGVEKQETAEIWRVHFAIVVALFIFGAIVPDLTSISSDGADSRELQFVHSAGLALPGDSDLSTVAGRAMSYSVSECDNTRPLRVQVFLTSNDIGDAELARHFAKMVTDDYPGVGSQETLSVTLAYGYDIGIGSQWSRYTHCFSVAALED